MRDFANATAPTAPNDGPLTFYDLPQIGGDVEQAPDPQSVPEGLQKIGSLARQGSEGNTSKRPP